VFGELPPGCSFEAGDPALGGWSSSEADLAQNEFKLPENQENESNLGSRFRPGGLKIGHRKGLNRQDAKSANERKNQSDRDQVRPFKILSSLGFDLALLASWRFKLSLLQENPNVHLCVGALAQGR
jgi:hypothetical protein